MKMKIRNICVMLVSLVTLTSFSACGSANETAQQSGESETVSKSTATQQKESENSQKKKYQSLNLDGYYPIVKEGNEVELHVGIGKPEDVGAGNPEDLWLFQYLTEKMNIKFKFTTILKPNWSDQKSLLFTSDDLFDVAYGLPLSTSDIILYGKDEEQLLSLNDYINKDLTPSMTQYFEKNPNALAVSTAPDGNIYTLPLIQVDTYISNESSFINEKALNENNLSVPKTLDNLLELARAWKQKYPESTPISGGYKNNGPSKLILSALGAVTHTPVDAEITPCIYKGDVIVPAANKEVYTQYITTMNQLYKEGLIAQDFFTRDDVANKAMVANGESIIVSSMPYMYGIDTFDDWEAIAPLTSTLNDKPVWDAYDSVSVGGVWLSKTCKYPDVVLRWFDWYYTDEGCVYMWYGPMEGTDATLEKVTGWYMDDKNGIRSKAVDNKTCANMREYRLGMITTGFYVGNYSSIFRARLQMAGKTWTSDIDALNPSTGDNNGQISMYEKLKDYVVSGYPKTIYTDSDTARKINDLEGVLKPYVQNQTASFITGKRPLNEVDAFISELSGMGMPEYLEIYKNIYKDYQKALNK